MEEFKRKAKLIDKDGNIVYKDIGEIAEQRKVIHTSLNDQTLARIGAIYEVFRPYFKESAISLEQFEFGFMKNETPMNEVIMWEDMIVTYEVASEMYKQDEGIKKNIYNCLILNSIGALTPEEEKMDFVKQIIELYNKVVSLRIQEENGEEANGEEASE